MVIIRLHLRLTCGEFVDYLSSICYNVIRKPGLVSQYFSNAFSVLPEERLDLYRPLNSANLDQSIRLLNEYAKTACRFINFEIWRSDFFNLFESVCDADHRLDRARFIECLTRFYQQQCRLPERARLVPPTPQMNVN